VTRGKKIDAVSTEVRKRLQVFGFASEDLHKTLLNNLRFNLTKSSAKNPNLLLDPTNLQEFLIANIREFYQANQEQMQGVPLVTIAKDVCDTLEANDFFVETEEVLLARDDSIGENDFKSEGDTGPLPVDRKYLDGYVARAREVGNRIPVNGLVAVLFLAAVLLLGLLAFWAGKKYWWSPSPPMVAATNHTHPEYSKQAATAQVTADQSRVATTANAERVLEVSKRLAEVDRLRGEVAGLRKQVQSLLSQRSAASSAVSTRATQVRSTARARPPAPKCKPGEVAFWDTSMKFKRPGWVCTGSVL
jgi:hypothetical protein